MWLPSYFTDKGIRFDQCFVKLRFVSTCTWSCFLAGTRNFTVGVTCITVNTHAIRYITTVAMAAILVDHVLRRKVTTTTVLLKELRSLINLWYTFGQVWLENSTLRLESLRLIFKILRLKPTSWDLECLRLEHFFREDNARARDFLLHLSLWCLLSPENPTVKSFEDWT